MTMTEHTAARTPAALAELLGLTVPQLAQRLASLTQTEGMTAQGLTLDSEHLTAAEVLGVLAACPAAAHTEPVPALDLPAPLNRENMTAALCHSVIGVYAALEPGRPAAMLGEQLGHVLRAAQVLAHIEHTPATLAAADRMTARALAAGAGGELYPADLLAQFRAAAQQNTPPQRCPRCEGEGEVWAIPYENPRECPECEGRGSVPAAEVEP